METGKNFASYRHFVVVRHGCSELVSFSPLIEPNWYIFEVPVIHEQEEMTLVGEFRTFRVHVKVELNTKGASITVMTTHNLSLSLHQQAEREVCHGCSGYSPEILVA